VEPLSVISITVFADRLEALVRVDGPMRTSAYGGLSERTLAWLPSLAGHDCDNPQCRSMPRELADTELAHLTEHVALDLIRRAGVRGPLRGDTSWDFEQDGAGVFRVRLDAADDAVALGALKAAVDAVNVLADGSEPPDVTEEATRLRSLRGRPEPRPRPPRA
jgi:Cyanophycin synthase-like N-terminal domain